MKIFLLYFLIFACGRHLYAAQSAPANAIKKELASVRHGLKNVRETLDGLNKSASLQKIAQLQKSIRFMELCIEKLNKIEIRVNQKKIGVKQALIGYEQWKTEQIGHNS